MTKDENVQEILKMVAEPGAEQVLVEAEPGIYQYLYQDPGGQFCTMINLDREWAKRINATKAIKYRVGTTVQGGRELIQVVVVSESNVIDLENE
ncbi:MAG: hypothetical protein ACYDGL_00835 [Bellilinea sp.]